MDGDGVLRPRGVRSVSIRPPGRRESREAHTGPGGRSQAEAATVRRAVSISNPRGGRALHIARLGGTADSPRETVQLPSDGLAYGTASGLARA